MKKCVEYEVKGARPRGRPKKIWTEVVQKDCQACKLNREDAVDRRKISKERMIDDQVRCFFWYQLTQVVLDKIQRAIKRFW